jgi:hypothetical protein
MSHQDWTKLIKEVAQEQGFAVSGGDSVYTIDVNRWHSVAYQMKVNNAGYIQAHQWEEGPNGESKYGRAVYSIRDYSGAVKFCQILINSAAIQARS